MVTYKMLQKDEGQAYEKMTFPAYRHLLTLGPAPRHEVGDDRLIQPIAIGAEEEGRIIGLALAEAPLGDDGDPELLSLYVVANKRNQGVGNRLLSIVEELLRTAGARQFNVTYMTGKPGIAVLEHILHKHHWDAPVTRMITVRFTIESLKQATWLHKYKLNSDFEIFPWRELKNSERQHIRDSQQESPWIPQNLVPWLHDSYGFETLTSLGVRYKGKVVGWVINHCIDPDTIRYTCSFIRKDLGRMGRIVPIYSASFNLVPQTGVKQCSFTTPLEHGAMVAFAKRRFVPWSTFFGETRGCSKLLQ